jgi:hypothetical protein
MMFWIHFWMSLLSPPVPQPGLEVVYRRGNVTFVRRPEAHRSSA